MITKDDILVIKNENSVVICLNKGVGSRLILPINKFKDMSKEEIAEWYLKEVNTS